MTEEEEEEGREGGGGGVDRTAPAFVGPSLKTLAGIDL